jgi:hypothetical protein
MFEENSNQKEMTMKSRKMSKLYSAMTLAAMLVMMPSARAQETTAPAAVPTKMTVTVNVASDKRLPQINPEDVVIKQGKERLQVAEWVPARGDRAGLDLFILIDDASDTRLGAHLDDLRKFINAQASTTAIGVGYMRNTTVQIAQDFTRDHGAAAKALRLPLGSAGAFGSPYLSVIDLMKRWPDSPNRREVIMVTDGIDRARRGVRWPGLNTPPDVDSAGEVAMQTGTMIHTIYVPGVGRLHRNYWEATNGQLGIAKLSDMTGGESYYLGLQRPVSLAPYLDDLQKVLDNQYLLSFSAKSGKKAGLQYVSLNTEVAGVDFAAPDAVWVVAAN